MRKTLGIIVSLALLGAGLAVVGFFAIQNLNGAVTEDTANGLNDRAATIEETNGSSISGLGDKTLSLTVPKMKRIENATIPTAAPDEEALKVNPGVRIPGTGLPWEQETNVYIAGHELGYPLTPSFRAFYDLKKLAKGDKIYITDAAGNKYTYEVFEIMIVQPDDLWVLDTLEGRNVVSLQGSETQMKEGNITPKRVVRAELVDTTNSSLKAS